VSRGAAREESWAATRVADRNTHAAPARRRPEMVSTWGRVMGLAARELGRIARAVTLPAICNGQATDA